MDVASPPKRMTRARAAASSGTAATATATTKTATTKSTKSTKTTVTKSAKVTTLSAKPATTTAPARPTTRKRKTRPADHDDDEDDLSKEDNTEPAMNQPAKKQRRGKANMAVAPEVKPTFKPMPQPELQHQSDSALQSNAQENDASSTTKSTTKNTVKNTTKRATKTATKTATKSTTKPKATRGRPKKSTTATETPAVLKKQTPPTITRTRTRKTVAKDDDASAAKKPAKKTARPAATRSITTTYTTEPTPGLKSAVSRPAAKTDGVLKKTVTFQEPEKENVVPGAATKPKTTTTETSTTGMRAKPVRKPAVPTRTTRASARAATTEKTEKKPLSPKKDGQNLPLLRDTGSDDELAAYDNTPLKPMMKSPIKPPSAVRKLELPPVEKQKDENSKKLLEPSFASVFSSPARRPPTSPFKDAMKSPAKRVDAVPTLIFSSVNSEAQGAQSVSKLSMLQSPAKRPQMPLQAFQQLSQEQAGIPRSPMKMSLLNTPAKRPASPLKLPDSSIPRTEDKLQEAPKEHSPSPMEETSPDQQLQSQIRAEADPTPPRRSTVIEKTPEPIEEVSEVSEISEVSDEDDMDIQLESPSQPQLAFPGRLSAVLPRHADPALKENPLPVPQLEEQCMDVCEPKSEEQSVKVCEAETEEHTTDVSEAQTEENPTGICEAEIEAQPMNVCETKSEEQPMNKRESETVEQVIPISAQPTSSQSPLKRVILGLGEKDLNDDYMSQSEDELALSNKTITKYQDNTLSGPVPTTPTPSLLKGSPKKLPASALRAASRAIQSVARGRVYVPYLNRVDIQKASKGPKLTRQQQVEEQDELAMREEEDEFSMLEEKDFPVVETTPSKGFFDDEMKIRAGMENQENKDGSETQAAMEELLKADIDAKFDKHDFNDLGITNEDTMEAQAIREAQATMEELLKADIDAKFDKHDFNDLGIMNEDISLAEVDEASLLSIQEADESRLHDDALSEASQEYGDENAVPIDPALLGNRTVAGAAPVTPKRKFAHTSFHTTSKVPLKPADDSPRDIKRHCSTVSKLSLQRPNSLYRDATSPTKDSDDMMDIDKKPEEESKPSATPSKSSAWSSVGTPARTPRRDLNSGLLRGAIVFVDVHTSEGADAGRLFVDLLIQMGARCVKSWPWNPNGDGELDAAKIGITHVVFKDGGKRTLEKVIESDGLVHCVQVGWVLDCEKENQWLSEKEYRVDTSLIPRGGHNRRKSMEPKALANMNGTLVTPMKVNSGPPQDPQTVPNNYMSRRDSTIWMRTPSDHDEDEDAPGEQDWMSDVGMLTPIPKTPAPEMVAQFAMDISPGTPTGSVDSPSPEKDRLLMQTCPPKPTGLINPDDALLAPEQQTPLMIRLQAARRKSMQYRPHTGSPLKKQWKRMD
ncbi:hypothetical protein HD806DRAFT_547896 [Xylariaceae sp. AK1471]|nr:hypothetical protein HD806DRAFT_547896 [Xylariaceae sp. AK1471]